MIILNAVPKWSNEQIAAPVKICQFQINIWKQGLSSYIQCWINSLSRFDKLIRLYIVVDQYYS